MDTVVQDGKVDSTSEAKIVPTEGKSEKEIGGQSAPEQNPDDNLPAGIKKRFAKLTRERYEAKSQYDSLKNEFDAFRKSFEQPKEYTSKEEYVQDLVAKEIERREQLAREKAESDERVSKYVKKYVESDVSDLEDFEDVLNSVPIDLNDPIDKDITDFFINSDSGQRLSYEVCKTGMMDTLRQMSNSVRAKTLIKLDEQLYKGISDKKATEVVQKTIEDAADTNIQKRHNVKFISPVKGKSTVPKGNGPLSMSEYMEQRKLRLAKKK